MPHGKKILKGLNFMANFHLNAIPFINQLAFNDEIVVEIGSDNCEGSTEFFDSLNYEFHSVDVLPNASIKLKHLKNTNWHVVDSGEIWAHDVLPELHKKIKILYLDNYDWANPGPTADKLKEDYSKRKIEWSNLGSQSEHLMQMVRCLPHMAQQSLIICDDTIRIEHHDTYTGKCGAVIPFSLANGYKIVYKGNNGVILARGL